MEDNSSTHNTAIHDASCSIRTIYARMVALDVKDILGPGLRSVVWLSGCPGNCRGCMSQELRYRDARDLISIETVANLLAKNNRVTISGGEPFIQADALALLLTDLTARGITDILIYTGYRIEELYEKRAVNPSIDAVFRMAAVIVDGPYVDKLNDDKPLRGSSNQRVIVLGQDACLHEEYSRFQKGPRRSTLRLTADGNILLIGMLKKEDI